ncbi:hypothetical protein O181_096836 [Austropuccinia psidii MF-1]|uniref:Uncharacterized protein n=1 Tax=Austropuccinia psidii MF-1 TaxID=1389203 RepID=A0A9Q3PEJ5_9BASI|nr:hypothetical protein [Austropuccinia psidii MF-1]
MRVICKRWTNSGVAGGENYDWHLLMINELASLCKGIHNPPRVIRRKLLHAWPNVGHLSSSQPLVCAGGPIKKRFSHGCRRAPEANLHGLATASMNLSTTPGCNQ